MVLNLTWSAEHEVSPAEQLERYTYDFWVISCGVRNRNRSPATAGVTQIWALKRLRILSKGADEYALPAQARKLFDRITGRDMVDEAEDIFRSTPQTGA